jgi:hypothetical protein
MCSATELKESFFACADLKDGALPIKCGRKMGMGGIGGKGSGKPGEAGVYEWPEWREWNKEDTRGDGFGVGPRTTVDIRPEWDAIVVPVNREPFTTGVLHGGSDCVTVAGALPVEVSACCAAVTVSFSSLRLVSEVTSIVVGGSVVGGGGMKAVGSGGKGGLTAPLDRRFVI